MFCKLQLVLLRSAMLVVEAEDIALFFLFPVKDIALVGQAYIKM